MELEKVEDVDVEGSLSREDKESSEDEPTKADARKQKRSAGDIRTEMLAQGAQFLEFAAPKDFSNKKWVNEWMAMAKYGFFVTSDGCIMPYKYYRKTNEKGDGLSGHIRAVHFFFNRDPDRRQRVNQHGWPEAEEISHLCHNPDCCNPLHLTIESRWRNWKRHYCGINGQCDCGMVPPCVRTYTNPDVFATTCTIETDISKIQTILGPLKQQHTFYVKARAFYAKHDAKAKNRNERKKRERKHKKEKEHKAASIRKKSKNE